MNTMILIKNAFSTESRKGIFLRFLVLNLTIGYITPPVGVNLFVASAVGKTSFDTIVKEVVPIFFVMLIGLAMVTFIPQLSLLLPNLFAK